MIWIVELRIKELERIKEFEEFTSTAFTLTELPPNRINRIYTNRINHNRVSGFEAFLLFRT